MKCQHTGGDFVTRASKCRSGTIVYRHCSGSGWGGETTKGTAGIKAILSAGVAQMGGLSIPGEGDR